MANNYGYTYKPRRAWGWGVFLILIAAVILANQFGGFMELGFWSIVLSAIAVAVIVQCVVDLSFGTLPVPIAVLYYIYRIPLEEHLGIPVIDLWPTLVLVTLLTTIGLSILIPGRWKRWQSKHINVGAFVGGDEVSGEYKKYDGHKPEERIEEGGSENNPRISVQFGGISRYLHADALESAHLHCSFGSLEIYFDNVTLSPNGADVYVDCKFGNVELYVPCEWRVINDVSASLGNAAIPVSRRERPEDAPVLRIRGSVSLGNMEIHTI